MNDDHGYFEVTEYKVTSERTRRGGSRVSAEVEVRVDRTNIRRSATGNGPVHALDAALRDCLATTFPEIDGVRLADYRVSVLDALDGTGAQVKVLVEATDGDARWDAGCVSTNIVDASFEALCSTAVMGIIRARNASRRSA